MVEKWGKVVNIIRKQPDKFPFRWSYFVFVAVRNRPFRKESLIIPGEKFWKETLGLYTWYIPVSGTVSADILKGDLSYLTSDNVLNMPCFWIGRSCWISSTLLLWGAIFFNLRETGESPPYALALYHSQELHSLDSEPNYSSAPVGSPLN